MGKAVRGSCGGDKVAETSGQICGRQKHAASTEAGGKGGHLLAAQSDGGNWVHLQPGEQIQVTATVGNLSMTLALTP